MAKTVKMIATKNLKYGTRRLQAGDEFDADDRNVNLLVGIGKAKRQTYRAPAQAVQADPALDGLRRQAERLGIVVDRRWGLRRLQDEIAAKR